MAASTSAVPLQVSVEAALRCDPEGARISGPAVWTGQAPRVTCAGAGGYLVFVAPTVSPIPAAPARSLSTRPDASVLFYEIWF